jgi:uncharacterized membrane protein YccF (DUF307 family)
VQSENLLWMILFGGLFMAVLWWIAGALMFCTVIGIPFALQHFKLGGLALAPVGKAVVSKHVAEAARRSEAEDYVEGTRRRSRRDRDDDEDYDDRRRRRLR